MFSIKLIKGVLNSLSAVNGLNANLSKSQVFLGGVISEDKASIIAELGFTEGMLSVRYLGVPLSPKKLSVAQCKPLVDRMIARISNWTTRFLSYAVRLQLVRAVLFGMQAFWAQIFIFLKKVMKLIESHCRSFLWSGSATITKKSLVAWDKVCLPSNTRGLNIINLQI